MTPRQIRAWRASKAFMPGLFAFGYPVNGRGVAPVRRAALALWSWAFRRYFAHLEER